MSTRAPALSETARPRGRVEGFTLVELLVVLGIMTVVAAVVVPTAASGLGAHRCAASARTLLAHVRHARADAVALGRTVRLTVDLDAGTWIAERQGDPFTAPATWEVAPAPFGLLNTPAATVRLAALRHGTPGRPLDPAVEPVAGGQVALEFRADGTATPHELWLAAGEATAAGAPVLVVRCEGLTGHARILDGEAALAEREAGR